MADRSEGARPELLAARQILDAAWEELRRTPYVQQQLGIFPPRIPSVSKEEVARHSAVGRSLLARLDRLRTDGLPHDLELALRLVRFRARAWAREADWYELVVDPLGVGFFGLFLPTAYCGGYLLNTLHQQLSASHFAASGHADHYLSLIADYARLIDEFTERTQAQATAGIRMPAVQVLQGRKVLAGLRAECRRVFSADAACSQRPELEPFLHELADRIRRQVEPAYDRALASLSDAYLSRAPQGVGISQYPGGREVYEELVKLHTTLELSPSEVHAAGSERMQEIQAAMEKVRSRLGFRNDKAGFLAHLDQDSRWRANSAQEVQALFERYQMRLQSRFDQYFPRRPKAPCTTAPLPASLQDSMTFGYYEAPGRGRQQGTYYFNAANLTKQSLCNLGALCYHELSPGHHLHFALQQENPASHPFRTFSLVNAFNEGWAEYAATFAGEIGLYEEPQEEYGRLIMDAFLTSRLVVDTGMNVLGWSLDQARDYMREHSGMTEKEIETESLRYACDIPGQALAYKLGDARILALRERYMNALGASGTVRKFHERVLDAGAMPLPDLEWHVEREIARRKAQIGP